MTEDIASTDQQGVNENHPKYFKSMIGKKVNVTLTTKKIHTGFVFCIDPVSESVILVNKNNENNYNTDILLGNTVKNIEILSEEVNTDDIFECKKGFEPIDAQEKKIEIKEWLNKHFIYVEDEGDALKLGEDLYIFPPYTIERCVSNNTIILERIQDILSKMPVK